MEALNPFSRRNFIIKSGLAAASLSYGQSSVAAPSEGRKLRIGIVGCGGRAETVASLAVRDGHYEIIALADYFQDKVDEKGEKYGVPSNRRFTGLDCHQKMIEAGGFDVIAILSPPYFHPDQVEAAVEAGLHVWLAKPIAVDARGVARIEAAAARAAEKERLVFVDFQTRALAHYQEAARLVNSGSLGKLGYGEVEGSCIAFPERVPHESPESMLRNWLQWRALSGEAIVEFSIHAIDMLALMLQRDPISATGFCGRNFLDALPAASDVMDHWAATYDYGDGVKVQFRCMRFPHFGAQGHASIHTRLFGTEGNLMADYSGEVVIRGNQPFSGDRFMGEKIRGIYEMGVRENWKAFHDLLERRDFSQATVKASVRSHYLALLARDACEKNGEAVTWNDAVNNTSALSFDTSALKA